MKKKNPNMGRPRKELENITADGWAILDANIVWANEVYCAEQLGMNVETLAFRIKERTGLTFPQYKEQKMEAVRKQLRLKQFEVAMSGNPALLIFLGKNMLGQSDKVERKDESEQVIKLNYREGDID